MTDVPLREHLEGRWAAHMREHEQMLLALGTARDEVNRRLEEMNELRAQITTERGEFLLRKEYEGKHEALLERIGAQERARANLEGRMWAIGAVVVVIQLGLAILPHIVTGGR